MRAAYPGSDFWHKRRVLVTGHTGFKGSWLVLWLNYLGAKIVGIGLPPNTAPNLFNLAGVSDLCESHFCDVRDSGSLVGLVERAQPEIVFHLAAQPLVLESFQTPIDTFATNLMGTVNLLDALRGVSGLLAGVMITTDKVYKNNEWNWAHRENDVLGGHDPYSASKAASELIISSYRSSFLSDRGVSIASARAGNVIGGGDWSTNRLIPDAIRAWQKGKTLVVRHPKATRPWQHVIEALAAYLALAAKLGAKGNLSNSDCYHTFNFGPTRAANATVKDVIDLARAAYGTGAVTYLEYEKDDQEVGTLCLDSSKAMALLGVRHRWSLRESIERTMAWYKAIHAGKLARECCEKEIQEYEAFCESS